MKHTLTRTSPKGPGQNFSGTCIQCGERDLPADAVKQDCPNPRGLNYGDALVEAVTGNPSK